MTTKTSEIPESIRQYYPGAVTTDETMNRLLDYVQKTLALDPRQVMLADSICSDDINAMQYPAHQFQGPFKLGGLAGYPFTGLTGMGAYAHHIPDKGAAVIYYGPHVGISKEGHVGKIHREGRALISGCCGAAIGALGKIKEKDSEKGGKQDYQMDSIVKTLSKKKDEITKDDEEKGQLIAVTDVLYKSIDKRIQKLVKETKFGDCQYLILVGVVLINGDYDVGSFNDVRRFDVINLTTEETEHVVEPVVA